MKTGTIICIVFFMLFFVSCTKEDRKYGAKGISVDSVGMVHNYIVEKYVRQFDLDSISDITECQLDSIFHRCARIALADSFFDKNPFKRNSVDNFLRLMDFFTRGSDTVNCNALRDWAGACEVFIEDKGLRTAIRDIHHSTLTGPALISYAEQRLDVPTIHLPEIR